MIFYVGQWRIPAANSKKHFRGNVSRNHSLSEIGSNEYADREAMDAFYKTVKEDKTFLEIHDKQYDFWRLIVEGSLKEVYTERVRF